MASRPWRRSRLAIVLAVGAFWCARHQVEAQEPQEPTEGLAAAAQNPVAAMYSLPFQNNTYFGAGPNHDKTANVLNIQPVLPFTIGDWNIISRTIAPLIYLPTVNTDFGAASFGEDTTAAGTGPRGIPQTFGLGDINQTFYFSPAAASPLIWGVGPSINLPTSTSNVIGSGKLSVGPAAVALVMPKPWVFGMLARQLFSIAGPSGRTDVNQTLLQPFVNDNLPDGWYLSVRRSSRPIGAPLRRSAGLFRSAAGSARYSGSARSQSTPGSRFSIMSSGPAPDRTGRFVSRSSYCSRADAQRRGEKERRRRWGLFPRPGGALPDDGGRTQRSQTGRTLPRTCRRFRQGRGDQGEAQRWLETADLRSGHHEAPPNP